MPLDNKSIQKRLSQIELDISQMNKMIDNNVDPMMENSSASVSLHDEKKNMDSWDTSEENSTVSDDEVENKLDNEEVRPIVPSNEDADISDAENIQMEHHNNDVEDVEQEMPVLRNVSQGYNARKNRQSVYIDEMLIQTMDDENVTTTDVRIIRADGDDNRGLELDLVKTTSGFDLFQDSSEIPQQKQQVEEQAPAISSDISDSKLSVKNTSQKDLEPEVNASPKLMPHEESLQNFNITTTGDSQDNLTMYKDAMSRENLVLLSRANDDHTGEAIHSPIAESPIILPKNTFQNNDSNINNNNINVSTINNNNTSNSVPTRNLSKRVASPFRVVSVGQTKKDGMVNRQASTGSTFSGNSRNSSLSTHDNVSIHSHESKQERISSEGSQGSHKSGDSIEVLQAKYDQLSVKCTKLEKEIKYLKKMLKEKSLSLDDLKKLQNAIVKLQEYLDQKTKQKYEIGVLVRRHLRRQINSGQNGEFWTGRL